jgi:hypothetical protein
LGFTGRPITVLATIADDGGAIYVAKLVDYKQERVLDSFVIANTKLEAVEFHFTEDMLGDAIAAFQQAQNGGLIKFAKEVQQADPSGAIEQDGINESGRKMRIASEIKNSQIATLAIALYATKASVNANVMTMFDELAALTAGSIISI